MSKNYPIGYLNERISAPVDGTRIWGILISADGVEARVVWSENGYWVDDTDCWPHESLANWLPHKGEENND